MAITWVIRNCDYTIKQSQGGVDYANVVSHVHYKVEDTDSDGNTGRTIGSIGISTDDLATGWTAWDALTEANVITMVKNALGSDECTAIEGRVTAEMNLKANPVSGTGKPWA